MSFVIKNKLSPETIGFNKELMEILNKVEPEFKSIKYKNKLVDIINLSLLMTIGLELNKFVGLISIDWFKLINHLIRPLLFREYKDP